MSRLSRSHVPLVCYVTDRRNLASTETSEIHRLLDARKTLLEKIAAAATAGLDWIQIREKDLSGKECSSLVREAVVLATSSSQGHAPKASSSAKTETAHEKVSTRILVNDRLDVALAAKAGGVHLGEKGLPPEEARRLGNLLRHEDFLIGVSCHSLEAAKAAERGGADYVFFGPVFATPSKAAAYGAPQGLKHLGEVCRAVAIPVLAIGGITLENASDCLSAGASGIAAIRLFQDVPDMGAVVRALRKVSI